ncbi:GTPase Era [Helicobacter sp. MIT 05-5293]|uniref:GTPase Era n=1 Tax=Helicobacter sp. MIT 05-5293 TaxID=1548149 RepID=UPI000ADAD610|nr:GTPase Era [Helicobacter sp. MIT 05-5293]
MIPTKSGFIATLGRPNAGKSTLLNYLIGENLALVSHKANATRKQLHLIVPYEDAHCKAQMIFVDTPGIHHQEKLLNQYMLSQALKAMSDCDMALYLAPISDEIKHYEDFLQLAQGVKHLLILTKIDLYTKEQVLHKIAQYQVFQDTFLELLPISVKRGFDKNQFLSCIASHLPISPFLYDEEILTTTSTKEICKEMIRESLFENLSDEIPYESDVIVTHFHQMPQLDKIYARIIVEKPSQKGVVIGQDAHTIKRIGIAARRKIELFTQKHIFLKLDVEVRKGWSKQKDKLKKIGYDFTL